MGHKKIKSRELLRHRTEKVFVRFVGRDEYMPCELKQAMAFVKAFEGKAAIYGVDGEILVRDSEIDAMQSWLQRDGTSYQAW